MSDDTLVNELLSNLETQRVMSDQVAVENERLT